MTVGTIAPPARRFSGFVVDLGVLVAVTIPLIPLTGGIDLQRVLDDGLPSDFLLAVNLVTAAYYVILTAWRGQTLGKMLARTRVVDEQTRQIPAVWQAAVRWAVPFVAGSLPGLLSLVWLAVYGWILSDERRQGLHDKAARTVVIQIGE